MKHGHEIETTRPLAIIGALLICQSFAGVASAQALPASSAGKPTPGDQAPPPASNAASGVPSSSASEAPVAGGHPPTTPQPQQSRAHPLLFDDAAFGKKPGERKTSEWYGGTLLIADGISMSVALIGVATNEYDVLFPVGAALGITDGLLVHSGKGRWGIGFLSLLLRTGGAIGGCAAIPGCFNQDRPSGAAVAGLLGGLALTAAVDIAFLAWKPIKQLDEHSARSGRFLVRALPTRQGALLDLYWRF